LRVPFRCNCFAGDFSCSFLPPDGPAESVYAAGSWTEMCRTFVFKAIYIKDKVHLDINMSKQKSDYMFFHNPFLSSCVMGGFGTGIDKL
ncbi:hypothetical protein, partial [Bartonella sp. CL32QHWL-2]|uniref:hypothetical protein n=1 Tax=Bartonella sp. CL32QHWL-2 TaxID=3243525 RepID=UPI0035CF0F52